MAHYTIKKKKKGKGKGKDVQKRRKGKASENKKREKEQQWKKWRRSRSEGGFATRLGNWPGQRLIKAVKNCEKL